jgi:hypothetical protein
VGIFRRGKNTDTVDATSVDETLDPVGPTGSEDGQDDGQDAADGATDPSAGPGAVDSERSGARGPYDASDVDPHDDGRLDLGALRIQGVPGMELRLEIDEAANQVVGATAVIGDSAVQL